MIELTDSIRSNVNGAIDKGRVLTAAYIDDDGKPHATFFGSIHAHSKDQLALWVRDPKGGMPRAIGNRPWISLVYADISSRTYYRFQGRARVATDAATRDRVFTEMHAIEQKFDAERKGTAIVIDLDAVDGYDSAKPFKMTRE
ncbi:MAG TPA: pyridoxamine 5'-phosphate oxidase family protein [Pseudomonadales bacterium]